MCGAIVMIATRLIRNAWASEPKNDELRLRGL